MTRDLRSEMNLIYRSCILVYEMNLVVFAYYFYNYAVALWSGWISFTQKMTSITNFLAWQ